jgi:hypothetical protein
VLHNLYGSHSKQKQMKVWPSNTHRNGTTQKEGQQDTMHVLHSEQECVNHLSLTSVHSKTTRYESLLHLNNYGSTITQIIWEDEKLLESLMASPGEQVHLQSKVLSHKNQSSCCHCWLITHFFQLCRLYSTMQTGKSTCILFPLV